MHVGIGVVFQNLVKGQADERAYRDVLELADRAEPMGYESIWSAEHHFSDYMTAPNVLQFLTYMAGRTRTVKLGSQVIVLPWHDPVRVAEELSVLDLVSGGRAMLGVGRGVGQIEFNGLRVPMGESRRRFAEYAEAILDGFDSGFMEFDGDVYRQPRTEIRPRPQHSLRGRMYAAAVSPESVKLVARLGLGLLIIPQKPWHIMVSEIEEYRELYREAQGTDAPPPIYINFVACHESHAEAVAAKDGWMKRYGMSACEHYDFASPELAKYEGYEYYAKMAERLAKPGGLDSFAQFVADLMVYGTPAECYDQIAETTNLIGSNAFIAQFNYGAMPHADALRNMDLFTAKVMPRLKALPAPGTLGVKLAA